MVGQCRRRRRRRSRSRSRSRSLMVDQQPSERGSSDRAVRSCGYLTVFKDDRGVWLDDWMTGSMARCVYSLQYVDR